MRARHLKTGWGQKLRQLLWNMFHRQLMGLALTNSPTPAKHSAKTNRQEKRMAYEKIVAVYDRSIKAREAMRALESAGFAPRDMSILNRDSLTRNDVNDAGLW